MKNLSNSTLVQDRLGRRFAQVLEKNAELPYEVSERLRAARMRALSVRRVSQTQLQTAQDIQSQNGLALLKLPTQIHFFLQTFGSILPLLALIVGLVFIHDFHNDQNALELAEVDSALLTDDLPPSAYTDPSFLDYLKYEVSSPQN
jgi:hypothetical protein